ncbi:hypothetical protein HYH03_000153 [Edaphochlamys debaryana]|uniref:Uncharacterized protein n=1 Tax=Edaphochlamys debaryana TaxID=47281 RepID=A0A835YPU2_9CHLO|nr:hypothetical protein HYH03_000153 [Edaphochlamys debaryana]|eukprot:KAG2501649.1 hypothetical protein HYH03_000153 [Edaphochlamys debaryana]
MGTCARAVRGGFLAVLCLALWASPSVARGGSLSLRSRQLLQNETSPSPIPATNATTDVANNITALPPPPTTPSVNLTAAPATPEPSPPSPPTTPPAPPSPPTPPATPEPPAPAPPPPLSTTDKIKEKWSELDDKSSTEKAVAITVGVIMLVGMITCLLCCVFRRGGQWRIPFSAWFKAKFGKKDKFQRYMDTHDDGF